MIHAIIAGCGAEIVGRWLGPPGASKFLSGVELPYAQSDLTRALGYEPKRACCAEVADDLAINAFLRACRAGEDPIGIGVTASIASTRLPRGIQRVHVTFVTREGSWRDYIEFEKASGEQHRKTQDTMIADAIVDACAFHNQSCGDSTAVLETLMLRPVVEAGDRSERFKRGIFVPCSLNPLHAGHLELLFNAMDRYTQHNEAAFLLALDPPHKPALTIGEALWRSLDAEYPVELTTGAPLFIDKAKARPGSVFAIGADTMRRMLDPAWGPPIEPMLREFRSLGVSFAVMDRSVENVLLTAPELCPAGAEDLFARIAGRVDLSSTELR